jgi:hypothetical protein
MTKTTTLETIGCDIGDKTGVMVVGGGPYTLPIPGEGTRQIRMQF